MTLIMCDQKSMQQHTTIQDGATHVGASTTVLSATVGCARSCSMTSSTSTKFMLYDDGDHQHFAAPDLEAAPELVWCFVSAATIVMAGEEGGTHDLHALAARPVTTHPPEDGAFVTAGGRTREYERNSIRRDILARQ